MGINQGGLVGNTRRSQSGAPLIFQIIWNLSSNFLITGLVQRQKSTEHSWVPSFGRHFQAIITNQDFPSISKSGKSYQSLCYFSHLDIFMFSLAYYVLFLTLDDIFSHIWSKNFDNHFFPSYHHTPSITPCLPSQRLRCSPAFEPHQTIPMITLCPPTPLLPTSSTDTILISSM